MGFFGRKKGSKADASGVSAVTTVPNLGDDADYVAPDLEAHADEEGSSIADDYVNAGDGDLSPSALEQEGTEVERNPTTLTEQLSVTSGQLGEQLGEKLTAAKNFLSLEGGDEVETESVEDGYVNANLAEGGNGEKKKGFMLGWSLLGTKTNKQEVQEEKKKETIEEAALARLAAEEAAKEAFDGVKGTVQPPKYKDMRYIILFGLHFGVAVWWFVDSFFPTYDGYYATKINHLAVAAFVSTTSLSSAVLAVIAFGYTLRHGETMLKTLTGLSTMMCGCVGVMGFFLGEMFMCVCGFIAFAITTMYMNRVWTRIGFTATNMSLAITAIRDNVGLALAALAVAGVGFAWLVFGGIASISAQNEYGGWTLVYTIFSYYWTHQVLTNVVSVATAGIIGRWFVIGEQTPTFSTGLKELLVRASTYSFGPICMGSLYFGIVQMLAGLSGFLWSKNVPVLPRVIDWLLLKMGRLTSDLNELAYVYVGLYGYSYSSAAKNVNTLMQNKGWDNIVKCHLAGNILFMANLAVGLITGFIGLIFGAYDYTLMVKGGLTNPTSDGFFVGFLVGFLISSIILSVVTATVNTLIVCLAESPREFKTNHPDLSTKMEKAWNDMVKDTQLEV